MFDSLFKSNQPKAATPSPAERIAPKAVRPAATPTASAASTPDTKVAYLSTSELNSSALTLFKI